MYFLGLFGKRDIRVFHGIIYREIYDSVRTSVSDFLIRCIHSRKLLSSYFLSLCRLLIFVLITRLYVCIYIRVVYY